MVYRHGFSSFAVQTFRILVWTQLDALCHSLCICSCWRNNYYLYAEGKLFLYSWKYFNPLIPLLSVTGCKEHFPSELSVRFEVDTDTLKVAGYGSRRPPERRRVWGQQMPPAGYRGRAASGSKMNLMFDIAKNWLSLSILNKFWSGWLIKNTPKKILISRVLQMAFPAFSRGISHQKGNHNRK